jgi:hypothetical protein
MVSQGVTLKLALRRTITATRRGKEEKGKNA